MSAADEVTAALDAPVPTVAPPTDLGDVRVAAATLHEAAAAQQAALTDFMGEAERWTRAAGATPVVEVSPAVRLFAAVWAGAAGIEGTSSVDVHRERSGMLVAEVSGPRRADFSRITVSVELTGDRYSIATYGIPAEDATHVVAESEIAAAVREALLGPS